MSDRAATDGNKQESVSSGTISACGRCGQVLRASNAQIEELREENRELRQSAQFFAALSERLNRELRRRRGASTNGGNTAVWNPKGGELF